MADVFLSYKRDDQAAARGVADDLEAEGYSVFFDVRIEVGDSWDATIERELNTAKAVVVLWSPKSRESQWVRREAREAMARRILCPATIARCKVPLEFSDVQAADLIGRRAGDRAHAEWRRLCDGVGRCVGRKARGIEAATTTLGAPAPRAERKLSVTAPKLPRLPRVSRAKAASASAVHAPSSSRRALVIGGAAAAGAAVIAGGYYGWTRVRADGVQRAWEDARAAGTRRAVNTFLREHTNAPQVAEARAYLRRMPLTVSPVAELLSEPGDVMPHVTLSPDSGRILATGPEIGVRIWDSQSGAPLASLSGLSGWRARFSPDGERIVLALLEAPAATHGVRVYDSRLASELLVAPTGRQFVLDVRYSPDRNRIVTAGDAGVRCYEAETGGLLWTLPTSNPRGFDNAVFSEDSARILVSGHSAGIYDAATGSRLAEVEVEGFTFTAASFSAANAFVLIAADDQMQLASAATGRALWTLSGHGGEMIWDARFNADATRIVTAGSDRAARLWDTGGQAAAVLEGHSNQVMSARFSPDKTRVVTASWDETARIWDVESGAQIAELAGHGQSVFLAEFCAGGSRVFTLTSGGALRLWRIEDSD